jgi:hypothetical protein
MFENIYRPADIYIDEFAVSAIRSFRNRWFSLFPQGCYADVLIYLQETYVTYGTPYGYFGGRGNSNLGLGDVLYQVDGQDGLIVLRAGPHTELFEGQE